MAIYALDGEAPELPADGLYFFAETAAVIGRVRLHSDVGQRLVRLGVARRQ